MGVNTTTLMLSCPVESDELDDEIVETIIAKRPCLQDSDSDNETTDDTPPVTHAEAKLHILNLQRYFTQHRDSMMKPTTFWTNVPI